MNAFKNNRFRFSIFAILIVMGFQIDALKNQDKNYGKSRWETHGVITWDVREYYVYLPAVLHYHNPAFTFLDSLKGYERANMDLGKSSVGKYVGRFSIGMAVAYAPFYILADIIADIKGISRDGFSWPYQLGLYISGFVYSIIGFIFLVMVLRRFFTDGITAITLLCIGLGTNLFYYTTSEGAMTHATLFCFCAIMLYFDILWHDNPKLKYLIGLALFFGLAVLIRPTEILAGLIFILYGVSGGKALMQKINLMHRHWKQLLAALCILFLIALPQLLYWKQQTGSYIYYSYHGENFFFQHPHIFKGLFSYRKGWFVYTPVMLMGMAGFIFIKKYASDLFVPVLVFLILNIYVVLSWWCWWYGGSFGLRAFIDSYAFLSVPMAAFWAAVFKEGWVARISALLIAAFLCFLNLFQSRQYREGMLHYDSMSKQLYWATFLKYGYVKDKDNFNDVPNYKAAMKGLSETTPPDTIKAH